MSFSLAPAGSPSVPRVAATWVRATAVPALVVAMQDVTAARERAMQEFLGVSGGAYCMHSHALLFHLGALRDRLLGAAALFESYADRLTAHETVLDGIRARALACGLEVVGDTVLSPTEPADLTAALAWSDLASAVLSEHQSLTAWVAGELDAAVPSYSDPDLARWVADFLDAHGVGLVAAGLETTAVGGAAALAARERLEGAAHLNRWSKVPGPVATTINTVTALESDEPSTELMGVLAGTATTTATVGAAALLAPAAPVIAVGAVATVAGIGAAYQAKGLWEKLPQPMQDSADEVIGDAWDDIKGLGDRVVSWAGR